MALKLDIPCGGSFISHKSLEETYAYLSNLQVAIPENFPGLETFREQSPSVFYWCFKEFEFKSVKIKIEYATVFQFSDPSHISFSALDGPYSSLVSGEWKLSALENGTQVNFRMSFQVELPIPRLMKALVAPLAERELHRLYDRYVQNVAKSLAK